MITKKTLRVMSILFFIVILVSACGAPAPVEPAVGDTSMDEPAAEESTAEESDEMVGPTEFRMAMIVSNSIDSSWDYTVLDSYERVQALSPHGLTVHDLDWTEGVWGADRVAVLQELAETGLYDIIWCNTTCSDEVGQVAPDYPEILFVYVGSGNEGLGGNTFWVYKRIHEPSYLMGMIAGYLTETNKIGAVGGFAFDDVNDVINAFIQGAKDVNPEVTATVSFIESWYDPAKALEAGSAQVAAGVDHIYQIAEGFDVCIEDIFCYGTYGDYNYIAPDNVLSSAVSAWDPDILWVIDEWWNHETTGEPYDGNTEKIWFPMSEGAASLAPFHGLDANWPDGVYDAVMAKHAEIMDGTFEVELNVETPISD